eukprot:GFUD01023722.1.p1 GENE.GFUD01023722.1~~GFUD01023722.1.p1  ORF type:complete len:273 (-),score=76.30 GFUD01023722.1:16-834(-)
MAAIKLRECLESNHIVPTNIKFLFKMENNSVKEVNAHKMILAVASDVFGKEFYGSLKKDEDESDIVDASQEVFQVMINFIYNKPTNWEDYTISFLCSLYYLAEKYNIGDLKTDIIISIPGHKITRENVLQIVSLAEENSHHEPLSEAIYDVATAFLKQVFEGKLQKASDFFSEALVSAEFNAMALAKIMAMLNKIKPLYCQNCYQSPCLDGQGVTRENFVPGATILGVSGMGAITGVHQLLREKGNKFDARLDSGISHECTLNPDWYKYKCS